jgi:hypothetical protein
MNNLKGVIYQLPTKTLHTGQSDKITPNVYGGKKSRNYEK